MPRTILVIGNDGSGKTTFARRYAARLSALRLRVVQHAYYSSPVRSALRWGVERFAGTSRRKLEQTHAADDGQARAVPSRENLHRSGIVAASLLVLLWAYQTCMAVESWMRDLLCRGDVLVQDRSFIDDLVSVLELLRIRTPEMLVTWSVWIFPMRRVFYLCAGHEVEFARVAVLDLSPELHRRKSQRYAEIIAMVESNGVAVRRIRTGPKM